MVAVAMAKMQVSFVRSKLEARNAATNADYMHFTLHLKLDLFLVLVNDTQKHL